jgi:hypothetical protein
VYHEEGPVRLWLLCLLPLFGWALLLWIVCSHGKQHCLNGVSIEKAAFWDREYIPDKVTHHVEEADDGGDEMVEEEKKKTVGGNDIGDDMFDSLERGSQSSQSSLSDNSHEISVKEKKNFVSITTLLDDDWRKSNAIRITEEHGDEQEDEEEEREKKKKEGAVIKTTSRPITKTSSSSVDNETRSIRLHLHEDNDEQVSSPTSPSYAPPSASSSFPASPPTPPMSHPPPPSTKLSSRRSEEDEEDEAAVTSTIRKVLFSPENRQSTVNTSDGVIERRRSSGKSTGSETRMESVDMAKDLMSSDWRVQSQDIVVKPEESSRSRSFDTLHMAKMQQGSDVPVQRSTDLKSGVEQPPSSSKDAEPLTPRSILKSSSQQFSGSDLDKSVMKGNRSVSSGTGSSVTGSFDGNSKSSNQPTSKSHFLKKRSGSGGGSGKEKDLKKRNESGGVPTPAKANSSRDKPRASVTSANSSKDKKRASGGVVTSAKKKINDETTSEFQPKKGQLQKRLQDMQNESDSNTIKKKTLSERAPDSKTQGKVVVSKSISNPDTATTMRSSKLGKLFVRVTDDEADGMKDEDSVHIMQRSPTTPITSPRESSIERGTVLVLAEKVPLGTSL